VAVIVICATAQACQTVQTVTQFVDNHLDTNLTGTFVHTKSAETTTPSPAKVAAANPSKPIPQQSEAKKTIASDDVPTLRGVARTTRKQPAIDGLQPDDLRAPFRS
jgi:hypothetical protein